MHVRRLSLLPTLMIGSITQTSAFSPVNIPTMGFAPSGSCDQPLRCTRSTALFMTTLPDIESMKASELRKELQSYGISTNSFFEKSEFVEAVKKARKEGKKPISDSQKKGEDSDNANRSNDTSKQSRKEKLEEEIAKCSSMKIGELKKELESLGISTKSFFEKSEFVRALAEARVDNVKGKTSGGGQKRREEYDPSYKDVVMQKMNLDPRDPRWGGSTLIDVRLKN